MQQQRRQRKMARVSWGWITVGLAILLCASSRGSSQGVAVAAEIVATPEWQRLGENDTIPAGLHVRMDLTTGEKWVKLMDDNDTAATADDASSAANTQRTISTNGRSSAVVTVHKDDAPHDNSSNTTAHRAAPNYDFDAMFQALSHLPEEEKQRIKLPRTPPPSRDNRDARATFERDMRVIWEQRQAELKQLQEEHAVDLPELLKDRIQRLQAYLHNPHARRARMPATTTTHDDVNWKDLEHNPVAVLRDLEFQLADIDMARDFMTLGGWPVLVNLLSDAAHLVNSTTKPDDDDADKITWIQAYTYWTMGTAVKNQAEFNYLATHPVPNVGRGSGSEAHDTPVLDVLFRDLSVIVANDNDDAFKTQKLLYCLGAMLRHNPAAQVHWSQLDANAGGGGGGRVPLLARCLRHWLLLSGANHNSDAALRRGKEVQQLLRLVADLITSWEQDTHLFVDDSVREALLAMWTSPDWCSAVAQAMDHSNLQKLSTAVETVHAMAPYCDWKHDVSSRVASRLQVMREEIGAADGDAQDDHEQRSLLDATLQRLQHS